MDLCQTLLTSTKQGSTTSDSEFLRVVSSVVCVLSKVSLPITWLPYLRHIRTRMGLQSRSTDHDRVEHDSV